MKKQENKKLCRIFDLKFILQSENLFQVRNVQKHKKKIEKSKTLQLSIKAWVKGEDAGIFPVVINFTW